MSKVIFVISISLDGFISGANVRPEAGLGDGGEQLHEWNNSKDPRTREIVESYENTGATIVGRTTYDLSIPYWGADGPLGAARLPTVVVSHSVPQDVPQDSVYRFVNGVEEALETAKKAAGEKDISISGANVAQQFLTRGLIDEIAIHLVPVLFGSGTRLFEGLGDTHSARTAGGGRNTRRDAPALPHREVMWSRWTFVCCIQKEQENEQRCVVCLGVSGRVHRRT